ncbi:MAG: hypothetical protein K9M57_03840 [Phycisphaerae bacterium]|nr:hypothetical protein [Phycisphaerae bacterium]
MKEEKTYNNKNAKRSLWRKTIPIIAVLYIVLCFSQISSGVELPLLYEGNALPESPWYLTEPVPAGTLTASGGVLIIDKTWTSNPGIAHIVTGLEFSDSDGVVIDTKIKLGGSNDSPFALLITDNNSYLAYLWIYPDSIQRLIQNNPTPVETYLTDMTQWRRLTISFKSQHLCVYLDGQEYPVIESDITGKYVGGDPSAVIFAVSQGWAWDPFGPAQVQVDYLRIFPGSLTFPFDINFDDCQIIPYWQQINSSSRAICEDGALTSDTPAPSAGAGLIAKLVPIDRVPIRFGFQGMAEENSMATDASDYTTMGIGQGDLQNVYLLLYGLTVDPSTVRIKFVRRESMYTSSQTDLVVVDAAWDGQYHNVEAARDRYGNWQVFYDDELIGEAVDATYTEFDYVRITMNNNGGYINKIWADNGGFPLHVDTIGGSDNNDGFSRETAFATINKGVTEAVEDETVLVWPGVYNEDVDFVGKAITVKSAADAAHIVAAGNYAVSFHNGEGADSLLENFVIRDSFDGIHVVACTPTIKNVTVVNNDYGIVADTGGAPAISNSILWNNVNGDLTGCDADDSCVESRIGDNIDGLVGYWSFDEGDGTIANDSAFGNHDGTVNGATWVDGISGKALSFDGNDYVDVPHHSELNPTEEITISAWINVTTFPGIWPPIVKKAGDGGYQQTGYALEGHSQPFPDQGQSVVFGVFLEGGGGESGISPYVEISSSQWHYVAAVYDGSTMTIYLDSIPYSTNNVSGNIIPSTNNLNIGRDPSNASRFFHGLIDEVRIYNKALTVEEIQQDYQNTLDGNEFGDPFFASPSSSDYHLKSQRGRFVSQDPNDGYWRLDEVTSPCIDAGNPADDTSLEPSPNGGRVNMGAYGGTVTASRSMQYDIWAQWPLKGDINHDGRVDLADFAILSKEWLMVMPGS